MRLRTTLLGAALLIGIAGHASAKVRIDVDLDRQRMSVVTGSGETYDWPVSTGLEGLDTPQGVWGVTRLDPNHRSKQYNDALMRWSIFFHDGYAIHAKPPGSGGLGRPASHGCVRLSLDNAALLYAAVKAEGAVITVTGATPAAVRGRFVADDDGGASPAPRRATKDPWYDAPADDPAPSHWRRGRSADGFEGDAPTGW